MKYYLYIIFLPFAILHELAHYIIALLTAAKPTFPDLLGFIPKREPDGSIRLGYVSCSNITNYNALPVAIAPLLLLVPSYIFYQTHTITGLIIACCLAIFAIPSTTDFKAAFSKPIGLLFYITLFILAIRFRFL